jgi:hypothetical protein
MLFVIVIAASRAKLFALAQDYRARLRGDPFLTDMKFSHGATEAAVGVQVWVRARNRFSMIEGRSSSGTASSAGWASPTSSSTR